MPFGSRPVKDVPSNLNFLDIQKELGLQRSSFLSAAAPTQKTAGQLWYDSTNQLLKFFDNSLSPVTLTTSGGTVTSITAGTGLTGGVITNTGTIALDVPVTVAHGGTNATSASAARTSLGLAIGTDVQAYDPDLSTLAGLTATTDNFIVSVASAWASRTPSQVRTTLGLVIGTNVQAYDANLTTWAGKTAPSGTVLGTSDTQVLTNKDLTSGTNTFPTFNQNTSGSAASLSATLVATSGGTGQSTVTQGDLLYGASNAWSKLAKNTSAKRYLSNTGTNNDPAWAQIDLTNGVTGVLPVANFATGTPDGTKFVRDDGALATPAGAGDVASDTSTSVDAEIALFKSTTGKLIKRATTSGVLKGTSGVIGAAAGADLVVAGGTHFIGQVTDSGDRTTTATTDGTATAIAALTFTFTVVASAVYQIDVVGNMYNSGVNTNYLQIWQGTVGSGTKKYEQPNFNGTATGRNAVLARYVGTLTAGSQTINAGIKVSAGTGHLDGAASLSTLVITRLS